MNMLIWTDQKPTQEGWYFLKHMDSQVVVVCKVKKIDQKLYLMSLEQDVHGRASYYEIGSPEFKRYAGNPKWAGPIVEPIEDIRLDSGNDYPPTFENVVDDSIHIKEKKT